MYLHVWFQLNIIMFSSFVHHFVFFCSSQLSRLSPAGRVCTYFPFPGPHGSHSRKNAGGTLVAAWERDSYTGLWDMHRTVSEKSSPSLRSTFFKIFILGFFTQNGKLWYWKVQSIQIRVSSVIPLTNCFSTAKAQVFLLSGNYTAKKLYKNNANVLLEQSELFHQSLSSNIHN